MWNKKDGGILTSIFFFTYFDGIVNFYDNMFVNR